MTLSYLRCLFIICFIFLVGCDQKHTYSYYVEHPAVLKKAMTACEAKANKTAEEVTHCELVMRAANNIMQLLNAQQTNPELFGQQVLDAQATEVQLKLAVDQAQLSLNKLQQDHASSSEISAAEGKLLNAKKDYQEQRQQVKVYMAVLGMGSPD